MNYEDDAMSEVAAAILSVDGPYIDLSDPEHLMEQTRPIEQYYDLPEKRFPLVLLYIDGEAYKPEANNRYEIQLFFHITIVYKYRKGESKANVLLRGKQCLRQIYRRIKERQRSGDAKTMLYDYDGIHGMRAVNFDTNPDGNDYICVATGQITFNQLEMEDGNA
jgi:hypothetical protein